MERYNAYTRRYLLKRAAGIAGLSVGLGVAGGYVLGREGSDSTKNKLGRIPDTTTPTPTPSAEPTFTPTSISGNGLEFIQSENTPTPKTEALEPTPEITEGSLYILENVPKTVDNDNVTRAINEPFTNTLGLGSEMAIAEPGGLLVGPDFADWQIMYDSKGSIQQFSPVTQEVGHYDLPFHQNLPEGGWVFASGAKMTIQVKEAILKLKEKAGHNWHVYIRGQYADGKRDSDRNRTAIFSKFIPGHMEVEMLQAPEDGNIAFWSEGQFYQKTAASTNGGTNCGAEGCSSLSVLFYDSNTGAINIITRTNAENPDMSQGWKQVYSNWDK